MEYPLQDSKVLGFVLEVDLNRQCSSIIFLQGFYISHSSRHFYPCDPVIKMSFNAINLNYELENMSGNLFDHTDINKLVLTENDEVNKFVSNSIVFYILNELNHDIITEYHIVGVGNVDLYDITTRTIYIFDTSQLQTYLQLINDLYPDSEVEVIVIDVEGLPDDIFQRYLKLREICLVD